MAKVAKYTSLAALFLIPLLPLYVASDLFFPFITGKGFAFRILVEIAFVGWLALAALDKTYRPRFSWLLAIYGAFVSWLFIADLFAINAHKALWSNFERMDGFVTLIHVFLFFLVASTVLTVDKLWRRWWFTFLSVAALVCGYSLLQLAGGLQINQGGVRVDGTFGNAIYLAVYLMFAAFIAVWLAIESKGWLRYALLALAALSVIILFNTATRGAIVATVAGSMLAAFLFALRSGKRVRGTAAGMLIALVIIVGGFVLMKDQPVIREHPIWGRVASISLSELNVRFTLWSMAGEGITTRPLLGYGQEGYNYIFNEYYRPELVTQEPWFDRAHSAYIDWLVAGGIPALLLFLALLGAALLMVLRSKDMSLAERILLGSLLIAYALQAIVVFDNLFSYVPLAAVLAYLHGRTARPIKAMEKLPELSRGTSEAIVVPVAGVVILFLILTVNVPNMRAANHLVYAISPLPGGPAENLAHFREALKDDPFARQEIAEQLVSYTSRVINDPQASDALKNDFAVLAKDTIEKELERAPLDTRMYMQASIFYRVIGDNEKALSYIQEAEDLSPNRQLIMLEHAAALVELDRKAEAVALYSKVYETSPRSGDMPSRIAAGLIMAGDTARGEQILTEVFGTTLVDSDSLVMAYAVTKQYDKLIAVLKLQVESRPNSPDARFRLASAYALAGRIPEARAEIQATMARFPQTAAQGKAFLESL
jgi:O-antigen ligase